MLIDKWQFEESHFIALLFILNTEGQCEYEDDSEQHDPSCGLVIEHLVPFSVDLSHLQTLYEEGLIQADSRFELTEESHTKLSRLGIAFLVNNAAEFLDRIADKYGEVPDKLTASLIPYLDLTRVPAADRYVRAADNQNEFSILHASLETVRLELIKDQNKDELQVKEKRAVIGELEGLAAQIKAGFVRLSDLTTRLRPLLKSLADVCKDVIVIATAAAAGLAAIDAILKTVF